MVISLQTVDHSKGHSSIRNWEGTWAEVEEQLRQAFPGFAAGVEKGDLYTLLAELNRSTLIEIRITGGELPPRHGQRTRFPRREEDDSWRQR